MGFSSVFDYISGRTEYEGGPFKKGMEYPEPTFKEKRATYEGMRKRYDNGGPIEPNPKW